MEGRMAHVLLPCDLPFWPDILLSLFQVKTSRDIRQLVQLMTHIHHISCVSLDPEEEDVPQPKLFHELERFLRNEFSEEERDHFLHQTLPLMASSASRLAHLRPTEGFFYSLCLEGGEFHLDRELVESLLANAFFSTFPRRNSKTHPTLQDFNFAPFFPHLHKQSHRQKLRAFFRYFEMVRGKGGHISVRRKVSNGPPLTNWLCCNQPLGPFSVRKTSDPTQDLQIHTTSSMVGGDVIKTSTSEESELFFKFPELLVILCFVESLSESEVLIVKGISQDSLDLPHLNFCFADFAPTHLLDEQILLKELNRASAAFCTDTDSFSGEMMVASERSSQDTSRSFSRSSQDISESISKRSLQDPNISKTSSQDAFFSKRLSQDGNLSRKSSQDATVPRRCSRESSRRHSYEAASRKKLSHEAPSSSHSRRSYELCHSASLGSKETYSKEHFSDEKSKPTKVHLRKRFSETKKWSNSKSGTQSSERSMKTEDESYYTADDDSEDGGCSYRSDSVGFVLGEHERLDDFRKRIRKRTRRLRKRSSYMSSSSDMEDISEENPDEVRYIRVATSEPSLVSQMSEESPLCQEAEAMILRGKKKIMMMTSSNGRLKAYSYDGVNPNLPVPFKAKFRRRTSTPPESMLLEVERNRVLVSDGMGCLRVMILWLAASVSEAEFSITCSSEESLCQTTKVYSKIVNRKWTVGDLCSEIIRVCRPSSVNREHIFLEELFRD